MRVWEFDVVFVCLLNQIDAFVFNSLNLIFLHMLIAFAVLLKKFLHIVGL